MAPLGCNAASSNFSLAVPAVVFLPQQTPVSIVASDYSSAPGVAVSKRSCSHPWRHCSSCCSAWTPLSSSAGCESGVCWAELLQERVPHSKNHWLEEQRTGLSARQAPDWVQKPEMHFGLQTSCRSAPALVRGVETAVCSHDRTELSDQLAKRKSL